MAKFSLGAGYMLAGGLEQLAGGVVDDVNKSQENAEHDRRQAALEMKEARMAVLRGNIDRQNAVWEHDQKKKWDDEENQSIAAQIKNSAGPDDGKGGYVTPEMERSGLVGRITRAREQGNFKASSILENDLKNFDARQDKQSNAEIARMRAESDSEYKQRRIDLLEDGLKIKASKGAGGKGDPKLTLAQEQKNMDIYEAAKELEGWGRSKGEDPARGMSFVNAESGERVYQYSSKADKLGGKVSQEYKDLLALQKKAKSAYFGESRADYEKRVDHGRELAGVKTKSGGVRSVTTKAEYDALPSGSMYKDSKGNTAVKR